MPTAVEEWPTWWRGARAVERLEDYRWGVRTTRLWMNALAPLARPPFVWNHDAVMRWGAEGSSRQLKAPVRFARGGR